MKKLFLILIIFTCISCVDEFVPEIENPEVEEPIVVDHKIVDYDINQIYF